MKTYITICSAALTLVAVSQGLAEDTNPYLGPNNSWITLNGVVVAADEDRFELDFGTGIVTVEMDDWDWYKESYPFLPGDEVKVYGRVDDDLYETTTIEADTVYLKNLGIFYYANDADEEDFLLPQVPTAATRGNVEIRGTVTEISGRLFTIDSGRRKMVIDTTTMPYNPLDDKGFQKITTGDYVQVNGDLAPGTLSTTKILADAVISVRRDKTKKSR